MCVYGSVRVSTGTEEARRRCWFLGAGVQVVASHLLWVTRTSQGLSSSETEGLSKCQWS